VRNRRGPSPKAIARIDALLRRKGKGAKCRTHPKRPVTLGVVWADGRAFMFRCGYPCLEAWKKRRGRWACVVRVIKLAHK
jgi:hypothetical protein